jgi:chromosomal replication initiator protein
MKKLKRTIFNPKNTFESFVTGKSNDFALAASKTVAESPGEAYNPLLICGGSGLGKTHLLHAIGHEVLKRREKQTRVVCLSSEAFTNEYLEAIQSNSLTKFRDKYLKADVLLLDAVESVAGKECIQEEYFHVFNRMIEAKKQIVMTCVLSGSKLKGIEKRLVARFESGQVAGLQAPDAKTRFAIFKHKAELSGVLVPDEILKFLAKRINANVSQLEGALTRVISRIDKTQEEIPIAEVKGWLKDILHQDHP